jgi:hypothetical protein
MKKIFSARIQELATQDESKYSKEHLCPQNHLHDMIKILHVIEFDGNKYDQWNIYHLFIAEKIDVKKGDAKFIGEIITYSSFAINFCPFCGEKFEIGNDIEIV